MGKFSRLGNDLYSGEKSVDFIGKMWLWYTMSGIVVLVAIFGLTFKGFNLGIEFKGGTEYTVKLPTSQVTQANADRLRTLVADTGYKEAAAPTVTTSGKSTILITIEKLGADDSTKVMNQIATEMGVPANAVSADSIGASWGTQVAKKAVTGLIVFLLCVVIFIWAYFREWKMSVGALFALAHDIVISAGVYALSGFQVSPATITGFLTILGYSLYDTVVVFDKIRENTKAVRRSRKTYGELANLAVNQTLVRSINTSFVAILPVAALLVVSVVYLGAGDLQDLALSLFVGMVAGTYSSIFIAPPMVVLLKSKEHAISEQDRRAKARQRRDADRYANVPVFSEGMGVDKSALVGDPEELREETFEEPTPAQVLPRREEVRGTGRVLPETKAPLKESRSAGRQQPTRQPRSKRRK